MLAQSFGDFEEELVNRADMVTAIEFHPNGQYLATGDFGGRIVLLKLNSDECNLTGGGEGVGIAGGGGGDGQYWSPFFQFQSHEPEFDYLKSVDIAEKINQLKFLNTGTDSNVNILSANDKTIKLWSISDKYKYSPTVNSSRVSSGRLASVEGLEFPVRQDSVRSNLGISSTTQAQLRRNYDNAHNYHIHSLSLCSDGETFLSADDLSVNVWNYERSDSCYNIIDIKPVNMDDLTMVLTAVKYHPTDSSLFAASTSRGSIHMFDLRKSSKIDTSEINSAFIPNYSFHHSSNMLSPPRGTYFRREDGIIDSMRDDPSNKSSKHTTPMSLEEAKEFFASRLQHANSSADGKGGDASAANSNSFMAEVYSHPDPQNVDLAPGMSEVTSSISDFSFSKDGLYLIARDYLHLKVWDIRNKSEPVSVIKVNEYMRPLVSSLYELNCTFDKFNLCLSPNGHKIFSGSYSNRFSIYNRNGDNLHNLMLPSKSSFANESSSGSNSPSIGNNNIAGGSKSLAGGGGSPDHSTFQRRNSITDSFSEAELSSSPRSFIGKFQSSVSDLVQGIKSLKLSSYSSPPQQQKPFELRIDQKILHSAWHPYNDSIAVSGQSGLFIYKT